MISKSMSWNGNPPAQPSPFLLKPTGKDYLWGGNRLNDDFAKGIQLTPLAETWECSTHPDGPSIVTSGKFTGKELSEVLHRHPEYLGTHPGMQKEFPILIKLIDAKENLSIQVHPDDKYAREHENGALGKTEMWYVLDAKKDSEIVLGFRKNMQRDALKYAAKDKSLEKYLHKIKIQQDDVFLVKAGMVHGIGAGSLIAEIQENSNITYRLYDYNRVDKHGKKRPLHIEKALDVIKTSKDETPRQPMRVLRYRPGCAEELLCRCAYFQVERLLINTERHKEMLAFKTEYNSFQVFLCINGCGVVWCEDGQGINFFKGDCIFAPANSSIFKIHGKAQILKISC